MFQGILDRVVCMCHASACITLKYFFDANKIFISVLQKNKKHSPENKKFISKIYLFFSNLKTYR